MAIQLTPEALRAIFPKAPDAVLAAFMAKQPILEKFGVNHTRNRLKFAFAQVEHETSGFTLMRENSNYTPQRAVQIWPSRFKSVQDVFAKTCSAANDPDFRTKLMDTVYGGRMGNRPGTKDGSTYIGRGGPQLTGRDCYTNVARITGVPIDKTPALAEQGQYQPEMMSGFVDWKKLNTKADLGDFKGYVKAWNGGLIGMADREHQLAGNDPIINRLSEVERITPIAAMLPGKPPTAEPPKEVENDATANERRTRKAAVGVGAAGGANEGAKSTGTVQPDKVPLPPHIAWALVGFGLAAAIVATVLITRKLATLKANWN